MQAGGRINRPKDSRASNFGDNERLFAAPLHNPLYSQGKPSLPHHCLRQARPEELFVKPEVAIVIEFLVVGALPRNYAETEKRAAAIEPDGQPQHNLSSRKSEPNRLARSGCIVCNH
jgi:hypothetical protein